MSTSENVFWVPAAARWDVLLRDAKQATIWQTIDAAMDLVEKENPSLKGVLPKNYGRADLDKRLGELVDLIGSIGFTNVDHGADDMPGKVYEYFPRQIRRSGRSRRGGDLHTTLGSSAPGRDDRAVPVRGPCCRSWCRDGCGCPRRARPSRARSRAELAARASGRCR